MSFDIFLDLGDEGSGLQHIVQRRQDQFAQLGFDSVSEIIGLLQRVLSSSDTTYLGESKDDKGRLANLFAIKVNNNKYIEVVVNLEGRIITAYPVYELKFADRGICSPWLRPPY